MSTILRFISNLFSTPRCICGHYGGHHNGPDSSGNLGRCWYNLPNEIYTDTTLPDCPCRQYREAA